MADLKEIGKGIGIWFIGYILMVILDFIVPPLITALNTSEIYESNTLGQQIWMFIVILMILITTVLPSLYIIKGLKTQSEMSNNIMEAIVGALIFIITIVLTNKMWFMFTALASITTNTFGLVLYWLGFWIVWIEVAIVTPGYLIINSFKQR